MYLEIEEDVENSYNIQAQIIPRAAAAAAIISSATAAHISLTTTSMYKIYFIYSMYTIDFFEENSKLYKFQSLEFNGKN